ncbi:MAG: hypothetical protein H8E31_06615, partial [Planctomycetes bacterium]|nr:hypothetical protein [Planctomycetota bacterium]
AVRTVALGSPGFGGGAAAGGGGGVAGGGGVGGGGGGARGAAGEPLGDCLCARKQNDLCASDAGNELVRLAEIGYPARKDYFRAEREGGRGPSLEV